MNWKEIGGRQSWSDLRYYPGIRFWEARRTAKKKKSFVTAYATAKIRKQFKSVTV
jgi:hypothetical protein